MKEFFKKNYFLIKLFEVFLDFIFIVVSFLIGIQISETLLNGHFIEAFIKIFLGLFDEKVFIVKTQILYFFVNMLFFHVYQSFTTNKSYKDTLKSTALALFMSNVSIIIIAFMFGRTFASPSAIIYIFISQLIVFSIHKFIYSKIVKKITKRNVLIIGKKEEAEKLATKFLLKNSRGDFLKYVLFEDTADEQTDLINYLDQVDAIIISHSLPEPIKNNIISYALSKKHKQVMLVPKLYETNILKSKVEQLDDTPVFVSESLHLSITQRFIKRTFDLGMSLFMLIIFSPIMLFVVLIMKIWDKGPILYKQERITRDNKPFMLYKFRTMIVDAEKLTGPVWQLENDPRITKIGRFLRKTRIDELPQLFNVIRGDMSLIGPRPERDIFIQEFIKDIPDFEYRINVKPGITGLAQVNGKYDSEPIDKLRHDLIYIRKYSIWLDLKILLLTIKTVFEKDASSTLGLPSLEDVANNNNIKFEKINNGLKVIK